MRRKPSLKVYKSRDGWRWHIKAGNGEIIASGEAYTRLYDCRQGVRRFIRTVLQFRDY